MDSVWNASNFHAADGRLAGNAGANARGSEAGAPGKKKGHDSQKTGNHGLHEPIQLYVKIII
jgi:hypothetical protein